MGDSMSRQSAPEKVEVVNPDPKNIEVVDRNNSPSINTGSSLGKKLAATATEKAIEAVVNRGVETFFGGIDDAREEKKLIRNNKRANLQKEHAMLIQTLEKEHAKDDHSDLEKIKSLNARIDKINEEYDKMEEKSDGFIKGAYKSFIGLVTRRNQ